LVFLAQGKILESPLALGLPIGLGGAKGVPVAF